MVYTDTTTCDRCGTCVAVCPVAAISMPHFPRVSDACIGCGRCVRICPVGAMHLHREEFRGK
ncbi:MAG: DUF362 domain-containing protein [Fibrobacterota bacterium]